MVQGNFPDEEGLTDLPTEGESDNDREPFSDSDTPLVLLHHADHVEMVQIPSGHSVRIGRGNDVEVRIAESSVSRIHAVLRVRDGRLVIEDLGGRNGTRVNGNEIRNAVHPLQSRDVIAIGSARMIVAGSMRGSRGARGAERATGIVASPTSPTSAPSATSLASSTSPIETPEEPAGLRIERDATGEHATRDDRSASVVVADPSTERLFHLARRLAATQTTVLILGETGTGKDVIASRIHAMGPRASRPFVRLTCSAMPETLLESELFGHEKGAFTGADRKKPGYFEAASGGTLFLDEIGDMPLAAQARLLSVLETGSVVRLGSTKPAPVDVRVLCATHRDLKKDIVQGKFRQDLFYRIAGFTLIVPPLRDRPADIEPLALAFIAKSAKQMNVPIPTLSRAALTVLHQQRWPGNVRELRNAVEHAVVMAEDGVIVPEHLAVEAHESADPTQTHRSWNRLYPEEKQRILDALAASGSNQVKAAKMLNMSRRMLLYRMEKYGISRPT